MARKTSTRYHLVAIHPTTGRFHRATCHEFSADYEQMTEGQALAAGAHPCKLCSR